MNAREKFDLTMEILEAIEKGLFVCDICGKKAEHNHHLFSQTKLNKKLYPDFIHHKDNRTFVCSECHLNKSIPKWDEFEFCAHFRILPKSKSGIAKWERMKQVQRLRENWN